MLCVPIKQNNIPLKSALDDTCQKLGQPMMLYPETLQKEKNACKDADLWKYFKYDTPLD